MVYRIIYGVIGGSIVVFVLRTVTTLNIERALEARGIDTLLIEIIARFTGLIDLMFDPAEIWVLWLLLGMAAGGMLFNYGRHLEDRMRGRHDGPPFWYLRLEARSVRLAINHRWVRTLIRDIDTNLENVSAILTEVHRFPPLPAKNFQASEDDLWLTREYLRLILPNLSAAHIDDARAAASRFKRQTKSTSLAKPACRQKRTSR